MHVGDLVHPDEMCPASPQRKQEPVRSVLLLQRGLAWPKAQHLKHCKGRAGINFGPYSGPAQSEASIG